MIDYGIFLYAAPPRTGSVWFTQAMKQLGFEGRMVGSRHEPFGDVDQTKPLVTMVRHPARWLASYFSGVKGELTGLPLVDRFSSICVDVSFMKFANRYIEQMPGAVGQLFSSYQASIVQRLEDQPWALSQLLMQLDVPRNKCKQIEHLPVSMPSSGIFYSTDLRRRVLQAESELADRYDYY